MTTSTRDFRAHFRAEPALHRTDTSLIAMGPYWAARNGFQLARTARSERLQSCLSEQRLQPAFA